MRMTLWSDVRAPNGARRYTLCSKGGPKLAKQDSVQRFGGLSLPVLIGRRKVMVTPITDFEGVRSESQVDSTYDVTSCTEVESLSGTPLPDADTPPKKPFLFNAAARFQLSETKLGSRRVKPEENNRESHTKDGLCEQGSESSPQGNNFTVTMSTGPLDESPSPSCNENEIVIKLPEPCNGQATSLPEVATAFKGSNEKGSGTLEDVLHRQDTASTSASSDGGNATARSSDDSIDATSIAVTPKICAQVDAIALSCTISGSRDLLSVVQGHWRTSRDTPVRVAGNLAWWIRDSAIDLGGTISEVDGELQLLFSDGSIYRAELDETETVLKWSDGDVWKLGKKDEIAPALTKPTLSESFSKVLNAEQKGTTPKRRTHREPPTPAHQNAVSHVQHELTSLKSSSSLSGTESPEQVCGESSDVPQIIRCKDGDLWLRYKDGRTYHAALQPEGTQLPVTGSQLGFAPLGETA